MAIVKNVSCCATPDDYKIPLAVYWSNLYDIRIVIKTIQLKY